MFDPQLRLHQEWLGFLQPVGLVVSPPALVAAQAAYQPAQAVRLQEILKGMVRIDTLSTGTRQGREERIRLPDFPRFCLELLGWEPGDLAGGPGGPPLPAHLDVSVREYEDILRPTYAVPDPDHDGQFLMLIQVTTPGLDPDQEYAGDEKQWKASLEVRFERLLRENGIPIGLLCNGELIRLVYVPRGESAGHLTFPIGAMCQTAGRPILGALHMLLNPQSLFTLPPDQRLPAILARSRKFQIEVTNALAEQVLTAFQELLRGFQAADDRSGRALFAGHAHDDLYAGLTATLLRLVFLLYAEERGVMPDDELYQTHYSVAGLFDLLREDAALYPDTMYQRYGAWARLLTLFRLVFQGADSGTMRLPARGGDLFHPDSHPFLEGRPKGTKFQKDARIEPPKVADGVIYRVLRNLVLLEGERISYRALDVEQLGSVYEGMMGFELVAATGPSIAVRPDHLLIDLGDLLAVKPAERAGWLKETANCAVTGAAVKALQQATSIEQLVGALDKRISPRTGQVLPAGALYLQPGEARRRSGSHYTPRALTEPIVQTTLRPVLEALGENPTAETILDLKVCDPAMGSGAFLVEACRQLAAHVKAAWDHHRDTPPLPPDEDPLLHARRLVAQRCLYGVDKNPWAVDLAKLSLWLVTLARDHPFTFVDHALRHGDSLVGLTRAQVMGFHWAKKPQTDFLELLVRNLTTVAEACRERIHALGDAESNNEKEALLREADETLEAVRVLGDAVISAFFSASGDKGRKARLEVLAGDVGEWWRETRERWAPLFRTAEAVRDEKSAEAKSRMLAEYAAARNAGELEAGDAWARLKAAAAEVREGARPLSPFHWEIELPEVFREGRGGFDAIVGNPPFLGGGRISTTSGRTYLDILLELNSSSHGLADLSAYFFRCAFSRLRPGGTFGLIATNTIGQGETRLTGLYWICTHTGVIFEARRRVSWPGMASVIVSVVHVSKGTTRQSPVLNRITLTCYHPEITSEAM